MMPSRLLFFLLFFILFFPTLGLSQQGNFSLEPDPLPYRDYQLVNGLPEDSLELGFDYFKIDSTLDVFNVRDSQLQKDQSLQRFDKIGDYEGFQGIVNYGIREGMTLRSVLAYGEIDFGFSEFRYNTFDFGFHHRFLQGTRKGSPSLAWSIGSRSHVAGDEFFYEDDTINYFLGKFSSNGVKIQNKGETLAFIRDNLNVEISRSGKSKPSVSLENMSDQTYYGQLFFGQYLGKTLFNVFFEYGFTEITTDVNSTLNEYTDVVVAFNPSLAARVPEVPLSLARSEQIAKIGSSLLFRVTDHFFGYAEYNYIRMFREEHLSQADTNNTFRLELGYLFSDVWAITLGGTYYERQLNGILPFLYNQYVQDKFRFIYGIVQFGITRRFSTEKLLMF